MWGYSNRLPSFLFVLMYVHQLQGNVLNSIKRKNFHNSLARRQFQKRKKRKGYAVVRRNKKAFVQSIECWTRCTQRESWLLANPMNPGKEKMWWCAATRQPYNNKQQPSYYLGHVNDDSLSMAKNSHGCRTAIIDKSSRFLSLPQTDKHNQQVDDTQELVALVSNHFLLMLIHNNNKI